MLTLRLRLVAGAAVLSLLALALVQREPPDAPPTPRPTHDLLGDPLPIGALARLGAARFWAWGEAKAAVFTPTGRAVLISTRSGPPTLFDRSTGRSTGVLETAPGDSAPECLAISSDGTLAAGAYRGLVYLWDLTTGRRLRTFEPHHDWVHHLAFAPDGRRLVVLGDGVSFIDLATGEWVPRWPYPARRWSVALTPDARSVGVVTERDVELWDIATETLRWRVPCDAKDGRTIAIPAGDAHTVAAGDETGAVRLLDLATGRTLRHWEGNGQPSRYLAVSPDGRLLVSIDAAGQVLCREIETGRVRFRVEDWALAFNLNSLGFSPDAGLLVVMRTFRPTRLFLDASTGRRWAPVPGHGAEVCAVAVSPDGATIATAAGHEVRFWDGATGCCLGLVQPGTHSPQGLAFSPDGRQLAVGSAPGKVRLWDVLTHQEHDRLDTGGPSVYDVRVAFSPDGKHLAAGCDHSTVVVWHLDQGIEVGRCSIPGFLITEKRLRFADNRRLLIEGFQPLRIDIPSRAEVWPETVDLPDLVKLPERKNHPRIDTNGAVQDNWFDELSRLKFRALSPSGWLSASGDDDGRVVLSEAITGQAVRAFRGHVAKVNALAFTPDGRRLVSGSDDTTALVWDLYADDIDHPAWLGRDDLHRLWDELAAVDGRLAYAAMIRLDRAGRVAVPFLREKMLPMIPAAGSLQRRLESLDDEAVRHLAGAKTLTLEPLRRLAAAEAGERKRRLEGVVERAETASWGRAELRWFRALHLLQAMPDPAAWRLLEALASGDPLDLRCLAARRTLRS